MSAKKKPTGFVAICQCGFVVGALDYERTPREEAGRILSRWINDGCKIDPRFSGSWNATVHPCQCDAAQAQANRPGSGEGGVMADQPMFYVAEDRGQPGTAFASRVADGKHPKEDAKTLAYWARRGAVVKLVDGETMMRMLSAWKRPRVCGEGQA